MFYEFTSVNSCVIVSFSGVGVYAKVGSNILFFFIVVIGILKIFLKANLRTKLFSNEQI